MQSALLIIGPGKKDDMQPKMSDVAKRAGVALTTVSHTLSGKRPVSNEIKQRVYKAIEELGYHPHTVARALATKRSRTISLHFPAPIPDILKLQTGFVISAAETATSEGYPLSLWTAPKDAQELLRMIEQSFIDGTILMEIALHDVRVGTFLERNYPFVMIGHCADNNDISFVDLDFDYALHTAVKYLVELGHRHIALINNASSLYEMGMGYVVRAKQAFYQAMQGHGLVGIDRFCDPNEQTGYEVTTALLAAEPSLSALIIANEWIAGGVIRALTDRALKVPEDVSLFAVAAPPLAEMTTPTLTAIDFPAAEMGRLAATMLISKLEGKELEPSQLLLKPDFTVRRSTGPCRKR
jgi:DNA-binding LacI/PurR family transcriptional regulator